MIAMAAGPVSPVGGFDCMRALRAFNCSGVRVAERWAGRTERIAVFGKAADMDRRFWEFRKSARTDVDSFLHV